jgi:uncharacterized phage-associated protein
MINAEKVGQIAAFFLSRSSGRCDRMKLIKLMYLADRASLERYGFPISDDEMFSLSEGPILSTCLNLMRGIKRHAAWDKWVKAPEGHVMLSEMMTTSDEDLDELSSAELDVLRSTWDRFGRMSAMALSRYTHANCKEWVDPGSSRVPISPRDVFRALGHSLEDADVQAENVRQSKALMSRLSEFA